MTALALLFLLSTGLLLVGGIIYAEGVKRSALVVRGPRRTFGVWVRGLLNSRVVLAAVEPHQGIGHPGILGLWWPEGYGRLGRVEGVVGLEVTRSFEHLVGEPPPLCPQGPLENCPPVDIEAYAYPSDPSDAGLGFEEVTYETPLGPMGAWKVAAAGDRWALHVHGWTAERREAIRLLPVLHEEGMTSMVIDYRNDPGAPRDPTGLYRFGLTEWEDVEAAVRYALDHGAEDLVLVGYSTGAAHIMSFLERSDLAPSVRGLVFDAPNISIVEAIRFGSRGVTYPGTPIRIGRVVQEVGLWIADVRWKVDWDTTNYVERATTIIKVPTLVFHGTADRRIPLSVSRRLQALSPDRVQLVVTPAAGHVMSWNADPERYERYLRGFLGSI
ncbi:MAG: alpha/beta hydrolase [Acidimicrobiia bacterium]